MNYEIFPLDFIKRTRHNIKLYDDKINKTEYDVTNLINNCLGLIIIPRQKYHYQIPKYEFDEIDKKYGITKNNIKYEKDNNYKLLKIVGHIRNGLSHGHISTNLGKDISKLIIKDYPRNSEIKNFEIIFTVEEFKDFALKFSEEIIKIVK